MPQAALAPSTTLTSTARLVQALQAGDAEAVRSLVLNDKTLLTTKLTHADLAAAAAGTGASVGSFKYDGEVELDAYKCLGAYIGGVTALQAALLLGQDAIARDLADRAHREALDTTYGGGNTALHLATLLGARDVVRCLLDRGADRGVVNGKGLCPADLASDPEMLALYQSATDASTTPVAAGTGGTPAPRDA